MLTDPMQMRVDLVEAGNLPDLLHPTPVCCIDREQTRIALVMAFAGGAAGGLFSEALGRATHAASSWVASAFSHDVFLEEFVAQCLKIRCLRGEPLLSTTHLVRLIAHPPTDLGIGEYRRGILAELTERPELRKQLEELYLLLRRLKTRIEAANGIGKWGAQRRQLDVLQIFKDLVDRMAHCDLVRLNAYARRVKAGEPYRSLTELLDYDDHLATLDLKVRVASDGSVRGFELVSVQENDNNPFVVSPLRRWLTKLELFVRGYRFSDGEIMARLIDAVFEGIEADLVPLVQLVGDLEFYLGALGFSDLARAAGLSVCLPEFVAPERPRRLIQFYNPLLFAQSAKVVPCDVHVDQSHAIVLVTGPNSGGKTRLLQGLALAQVLAQAGLFIPASAGSISPVPGLVVSLIQETKVDQSEGRLGTELIRIRELFEQLPAGAMVVLDELCSGTNPSEGEEIFELVLRMLSRLRPQTFITTHFLAFAARLERERNISGLRFLQVQIGPNQQPTYAFVPGVASTSLAAQTAARLGVTGDQLQALVERKLSAVRAVSHEHRGE
ncbi:MAG TPA: DNA mismatch repair protein [Polyangiaceae bacterium]